MSGELAALELVVCDEPLDRVRLSLIDGSSGEHIVASELTIDLLQLSDGAGNTIQVGGIGNVETSPSHRRRGLASMLLREAIDRMHGDQLDASLLYGIDDFYDQLGWRSCGDERWVRISAPERGLAAAQDVSWRAARATDIDAIRSLYDSVARVTPGAVVRPAAGRAWGLLDPLDVVVIERDGELAGYAWRGRGVIDERDGLARREAEALVFAEAHAVDQDAMLDLVSAACAFARAATDEAGRRALMIGAPETHPLRTLARSGELRCRLVDNFRPTGGPMLLPFTPRGDLRGELYQYLPDRF